MEHYFTEQTTADSHPESWTWQIAGKTYSFTSDAGVFSKGQVDFGSQLLVETVIDQAPLNGDFLDVGCGYGPMGLVLADQFPDVHGNLVDINERAMDLAQKNLQVNQVTNAQVFASNIYEGVDRTDYQTIVSNPPIRAGKVVVHQILEEAYDHLAPGGQLIIVIQKKQGAPSAKKKMAEVYGNVDRIGLDRGYWILRSVKES